MPGTDWRDGVPLDVLALVAKAGGCSSTKEMRGVAKAWQQGFELAVTSITINHGAPPLPSGDAAFALAQRFPSLSILNLGQSDSGDACLLNLSAHRRLESLVLGLPAAMGDLWPEPVAPPETLAARLTDNGLQNLIGLPLTNLSLRCCKQVTDAGMAARKDLPLKNLSLYGMAAVASVRPEGNRPVGRLTDASLAAISGLKLESLDLGSWLFTPGGVRSLLELPLARLNLFPGICVDQNYAHDHKDLDTIVDLLLAWEDRMQAP